MCFLSFISLPFPFHFVLGKWKQLLTLSWRSKSAALRLVLPEESLSLSWEIRDVIFLGGTWWTGSGPEFRDRCFLPKQGKQMNCNCALCSQIVTVRNHKQLARVDVTRMRSLIAKVIANTSCISSRHPSFHRLKALCLHLIIPSSFSLRVLLQSIFSAHPSTVFSNNHSQWLWFPQLNWVGAGSVCSRCDCEI